MIWRNPSSAASGASMVCERIVPGFGELMRAASVQKTPMAALSRAIACTCGPALVINVPGSISGATENLAAVMHLIPHALELLGGRTEHNVKDEG